MKIQVKASELAKKMQRALGVVQAKVTIPALAYVKLDVQNATAATLSGSDLGMSMIQTVGISLVSSEAGSMLLPARTISKFLTALPGEQIVTIEGEDKNLTFKAGKLVNAKLNGMDVKLFPPIEARTATQFNLNAAAFKKIISRVEAAAPAKAGRQSVPSLLLESTTSQLRAVATDGFRIAVADAKGAGAGDFTLQIPKIFLPLIKEIPGEVIQFSQSETNYFFATENETLLIRIPTTQFPGYQKAYGFTGFLSDFEIAVPSVKTALDIIAATQDSKSPGVYVTATAEEVVFASSSAADGQTESAVDIKLNGQANKVKLNQSFIVDFLGQVEGSIKVQITGPTGPVKLTSGDDFQYFIMPMMEEAPKAEAETKAKAKSAKS